MFETFVHEPETPKHVRFYGSSVAELVKLPFYYDDDGPEAILIKNGDSFFDRHQTFYPRLVNKNQSTEIRFFLLYSDKKERLV